MRGTDERVNLLRIVNSGSDGKTSALRRPAGLTLLLSGRPHLVLMEFSIMKPNLRAFVLLPIRLQ